MHKIGVTTKYEFHDVIGLDAECMNFLPKPVCALIFLFPPDEDTWPNRRTIKLKPDDPFFILQDEDSGDQCGAIALLHALANNKDKLSWSKGSTFDNFLRTGKNLTPQARLKLLDESEDDETGVDMFDVMEEEAYDEEVNQTEWDEDDQAEYHFICFVEHNGFIYELDGFKNT